MEADITGIEPNPGSGHNFTILTQRDPAAPILAWQSSLVSDYPALALVA